MFCYQVACGKYWSSSSTDGFWQGYIHGRLMQSWMMGYEFNIRQLPCKKNTVRRTLLLDTFFGEWASPTKKERETILPSKRLWERYLRETGDDQCCEWDNNGEQYLPAFLRKTARERGAISEDSEWGAYTGEGVPPGGELRTDLCKAYAMYRVGDLCCTHCQLASACSACSSQRI